MAKTDSVLTVLDSMKSQMPTDRKAVAGAARAQRQSPEGGQLGQEKQLDEDFLNALGDMKMAGGANPKFPVGPDGGPLPPDEGTADEPIEMGVAPRKPPMLSASAQPRRF